MKFQMIDYSDYWFKDLNDTEFPAKRKGKFVVIMNNENVWCVLSPEQLSRMHADIVEHFFQERNIEYDSESPESKFNLEGIQWQICGGGMWEIHEENKVLLIHGASQAYGHAELDFLKKQLHDLNLFEEVIIG